MDREKVIEALHCRAYDDDFPCSICAYYRPDEKPVAKCDYRGLMDDAIALLKEQEDTIRILSADYEDLQKEHERLLDKKIPLITQGQEVVRCKDCKHGYQLCDDYISCEISEENESGCPASHKPDWFCADGERKCSELPNSSH